MNYDKDLVVILAPTLSYHRVNDSGHPFFGGTPTRLFRRQMDLLRSRFDVQPLRVLTSGDVPRNAVAITFDDGYRDNYTHAFPILRELGIPATIFLVTEAVDGNGMIWHDRIFDAYHRTAARSRTGAEISPSPSRACEPRIRLSGRHSSLVCSGGLPSSRAMMDGTSLRGTICPRFHYLYRT